MHVDEETFRYALGHFASGVTVVTSAIDGERHGTTVSAFCSVSLNPPLVLICLDGRSGMVRMIERANAFAVNVLAEDQELVARHFASPMDDRLAAMEYETGQTGVPLLVGVLASIECSLNQKTVAGDHTIFIGEVHYVVVREGKPLLYYRGGYNSMLG
jgi:flavin reductase (DIM6/NTAB) family NADH-FMN oxidoreductase RutF